MTPRPMSPRVETTMRSGLFGTAITCKGSTPTVWRLMTPRQFWLFSSAPGAGRSRSSTLITITSPGVVLPCQTQPLGPYISETGTVARSEEHTSELQSLMRISYAVFCLKKKKTHKLQQEQERRDTPNTSTN